RWLQWDPVRMAPMHAGTLRGLRAVWVDAGRSDEWYLDLGAEAFRAALQEAGVEGDHFELFDGKHSGLGWRYPLSLAFLAQRLA
ncbi:MAG: enterochelin esterase, partial [Actinobacteria bacterium]|nr:enterochelin esterase [Actinomycetota bacterium]